MQMAGATCDALEACGSLLLPSLFGDRATCLARLAEGCAEDQGVPGTSRTLADIAACAGAMATASCHELLISRYPAACAVKPGARADGAACGSDWQCQSTHCRRSGDCGVCAPRAGEGGACTTDSGCLPAMRCTGVMCATPGEVCSGSADPAPWALCASDSYCSRPVSGGSCVVKYGPEGGCETGVLTNGGLLTEACDLVKGVACNPASKTCRFARVVRAGEACGLVDGYVGICAGRGRCVSPVPLSTSLTGICAEPAADGAACGTAADGAACVPPARCEVGMCRRPSNPSCG
jgi:hypothetical protein